MVELMNFIFSGWGTYFGTLVLILVCGAAGSMTTQHFKRDSQTHNNFITPSQEQNDE